LIFSQTNGGVFGDMLFLGIKIYAKAAFSLLFSLFSFLWKRQCERREKNEKRKAKSTKRNDNLLSKIVVSFWHILHNLIQCNAYWRSVAFAK